MNQTYCKHREVQCPLVRHTLALPRRTGLTHRDLDFCLGEAEDLASCTHALFLGGSSHVQRQAWCSSYFLSSYIRCLRHREYRGFRGIRWWGLNNYIIYLDEKKNRNRVSVEVSPVFIAASAARNAIAYMIDFFLSNRPGRRIHAVAGCTIKT